MADKKRTYSEIALFIITIIWGLGFPITKIATSNGFGPSTIMVGRFLIATIILGVVYRKRLHKINKQYLIYGSITGVFLFVGFYFQTLGNVYTSASKNGFITQLNIVLVPYLYYLFFRKKVGLNNLLAVVVAIVGMFIMVYSKDQFNAFNIGDFYTVICAIMVAFNVVTTSYFQKKYDLDTAVFIMINFVVSAILSIIITLTSETLPSVTLIDFWPLIFLGVLNTGLGFLVQGYALKYSLPTRVSLIVTLEGVVSAVGAVLIINDVIPLNVIIGGILIIIAVVISEMKFNNKEKNNKLLA